MNASVKALQDYLVGLPPGSIDDSVELSDVLAEAWESLAGSDEGGMQAYKVRERMESTKWSPPHLEFTIERHGGTVLGSSRATLQTWSVDVAQGTVDLVRGGSFRQLRPASAKVDVVPLADAVAAAVLSGGNDRRLKWSADRTSVRVQIGELIPDEGPMQTTASRRKRFRAALNERLSAAGWTSIRPNTYRRP